MIQSQAFLFLNETFVGELHYQDAKICLVYGTEWKQGGFAISHSLPLDNKFSADASHNFFSNLLPEGSLRDLICQKLQISRDNDWSLLLALGKESAGALTITNKPQQFLRSPKYKKMDEKLLEDLSEKRFILPTILSEESTRLSLAGAQDKIAVYFDGVDYFLPVNGSPTNTILKFENEFFKGITVNEVFVTRLASRIGLPTSDASLYMLAKNPIAVFVRYDRITTKEGLRRLHQEDLCQALGKSQKTKYQKEGGPSFFEVLSLVGELSSRPLVDRENLIKWQLFNILCGNSDGHAKNLSLFRSPESVHLTPFYDLVCTRIYPHLDRKLAMSFADTFDPDLLDVHRVEKWAKEIGVTKRFLLNKIQAMAELLSSELTGLEEEFSDRFGQFEQIEKLRLFIRKQIKRASQIS